MEKKSNSTSSRTRSSSICSRIRQALESYPAFRAIRRINQYNNKPEPPNHHHHHHNNKPITITTTTHSNNPPSSSSNPSSSPTKHIAKNTASVFQSNPPLRQHVKVMMNTEGRGEGALIPINFDYSTTTPPPSSSSLSISKVTSPQPRKGHHHGLGMQHSSEQQQEQQEGGKKSLDINDTFAEYIQRTKNNFRRSASNVGPSQGNSATISHHEANDISANNTNAIKMENQKDPFFDFIQRSAKRLRTTSNVAKVGGSFKRG